MPLEMMKEFINRLVTIYSQEFGSLQGTLLAIEGNWLKIEEKKNIRFINGDMITHIKVSK